MRPSREVLAKLFEGAPRFLQRLTEEEVSSYHELLDRAEQIVAQMPEAEWLELINGHPRIGASPETVSTISFGEQGYERLPAVADFELRDRLERLNDRYEVLFGFRFTIFVAERSRSAIADILESQLEANREDELHRALSDVFLIARSRLDKLPQPRDVAR